MQLIKLSSIKPDPDQPRQVFEPSSMLTLETSIKEKGILMPLIVEEVSKDNYLVIDGERRYRTAKKIGIEKVPVEIMSSMTPTERMITRFHLQEQHQSWSPFDKARAIYFFMKQEGLTMNQVASLLGMSQSTVHMWVGILELSKQSQIKSIERKIPFTYLSKIVRISKAYKEISDLSIIKIEEILFDRIETHTIGNSTDLSNLAKYLNLEGNNEKKLKFLEDSNYTVNNLLTGTPEGKSVELDTLVFRSLNLTNKIKFLHKNKYNTVLTDRQKVILEELKNTIKKFIT